MINRLAVTLLLILTGICSVSAQTIAVVDSGLVDQDYRYYDKPIVPELYIIRPGEKLVVTFIGTKLTSMALNVGPDGKVVHRSLGVFGLAGKTLSETRNLLAEPLVSLYNVSSMEISVSDPYEVAIAVTGAVNQPGLYKGYTSQLVSELIEKAGGVADNGSTRRIVLSGGSGNIPVDLDRARYLGDHSANPCLYAGTHLFVPERSDESMTLVGAVNDPREIELLIGDDIDLLVALAGGLQRSADMSAAHILGEPDRDLNAVQKGDIILVPLAEMSQDQQIIILGSVNRPGKYRSDSEMTLEDLVAMAGGLTSEANLDRITVFRKPTNQEWSRPIRFRFPINCSLSQHNSSASISLQPTDSVFVPKVVGYVRVSGMVRNPGYFMYVKGEDARFYVGAGGGFASDADQSELTVFNRVTGMSSLVSPDAIVSDGDELIIHKLVAEQ